MKEKSMAIAAHTAASPNDATLPEMRALLAPLLPQHAVFDGWSAKAVAAAAEDAGLDADLADLAMGADAMGLIDAWIASVDSEIARRLPPEKLAAMKIRARITALIEARLEIAAPNKEAVRRAMAIMAMPQNLRKTVRFNWRTADHMWRLAGDNATDFNHYTKRTTLAAVYSSTMLVFLSDESEDYAETRAFLARRIENVMQFEKAKAGWKNRRENLPRISRFMQRVFSAN